MIDLHGQYDHLKVVEGAMGVIEQGKVHFDDWEMGRLVHLELIAMGFEPDKKIEPDYSVTITVTIAQ